MGKGMSNAVRHAEYRIARLIDAMDRREKSGKREEESNDEHMRMNADGTRVWSY
jgi:hypothetical protein